MSDLYNFHSINKRIGVVPSIWKLVDSQIDERRKLELIQKVGFQILDVNIFDLARDLIGKIEYKRSISLEAAPKIFSCATFVRYLYAQLGIELPVYAVDQSKMGIEVSINLLRAGDLVFAKGRLPQYDFDPNTGIGHVGLLTDKGTVLHTTNLHINHAPGIGETSFEQFYKNKDYFQTARRILPEQGFYTLQMPNGMDILWSTDVQRKILQYI